jgi:hypothetical protein
MSNPHASNSPRFFIDPKKGLMLGASDLLIPFFKNANPGAGMAEKMALSAIAAYEPETRADYVNIARTIAFSMAAIILLRKATADDTPAEDTMRLFGHAIALNRTADQSERTMMQRRRYQKLNPPAKLPAWMDPGSEPPASKPEAPIEAAQIRAAVAEAMRNDQSQRKPASAQNPPPVPVVQPVTNAGSRPEPALSPIQTQAASPASAIRYSAPLPDTHSSQKAPYKAALMQNTPPHNRRLHRPLTAEASTTAPLTVPQRRQPLLQVGDQVVHVLQPNMDPHNRTGERSTSSRPGHKSGRRHRQALIPAP